MMAEVISQKSLDENKVWLKVERINDALRVTDQDGRELGGVVEFLAHCNIEDLTKCTITVECASRKETGKIQYNIRG